MGSGEWGMGNGYSIGSNVPKHLFPVPYLTKRKTPEFPLGFESGCIYHSLLLTEAYVSGLAEAIYIVFIVPPLFSKISRI